MDNNNKNILEQIKNHNADESFVAEEFNRRGLKKEITRQSYTITYDALGRAFISDEYSTISSTAEIAIKKHLIRNDILSEK